MNEDEDDDKLRELLIREARSLSTSLRAQSDHTPVALLVCAVFATGDSAFVHSSLGVDGSLSPDRQHGLVKLIVQSVSDALKDQQQKIKESVQ